MPGTEPAADCMVSITAMGTLVDNGPVVVVPVPGDAISEDDGGPKVVRDVLRQFGTGHQVLSGQTR